MEQYFKRRKLDEDNGISDLPQDHAERERFINLKPVANQIVTLQTDAGGGKSTLSAAFMRAKKDENISCHYLSFANSNCFDIIEKLVSNGTVDARMVNNKKLPTSAIDTLDHYVSTFNAMTRRYSYGHYTFGPISYNLLFQYKKYVAATQPWKTHRMHKTPSEWRNDVFLAQNLKKMVNELFTPSEHVEQYELSGFVNYCVDNKIVDGHCYTLHCLYKAAMGTINAYHDVYIVDEAQDIDTMALKFFLLLKNKTIIFVGDKKQSIFSSGENNMNVFTYLIRKKIKTIDYTLNCTFRTGNPALKWITQRLGGERHTCSKDETRLVGYRLITLVEHAEEAYPDKLTILCASWCDVIGRLGPYIDRVKLNVYLSADDCRKLDQKIAHREHVKKIFYWWLSGFYFNNSKNVEEFKAMRANGRMFHPKLKNVEGKVDPQDPRCLISASGFERLLVTLSFEDHPMHIKFVSEALFGKSHLLEYISARADVFLPFMQTYRSMPRKINPKFPTIHATSVHAYKGLEAGYIYIDKSVLPHYNSNRHIRFVDKMCLYYVALTRAKKAIYLDEDSRPPVWDINDYAESLKEDACIEFLNMLDDQDCRELSAKFQRKLEFSKDSLKKAMKLDEDEARDAADDV